MEFGMEVEQGDFIVQVSWWIGYLNPECFLS